METYNGLINFFIHNWILSSLLIFILALLINDIAASFIGTINYLDPTTLVSTINKEKNLVLVDIREKDQFQAGHIIGAVNYPASQPDKLQSINPDKIIVIYDEDGTTYRTLKSQIAPYKNLSMLKGGFKKWQQDHLPIVYE